MRIGMCEGCKCRQTFGGCQADLYLTHSHMVCLPGLEKPAVNYSTHFVHPRSDIVPTVSETILCWLVGILNTKGVHEIGDQWPDQNRSFMGVTMAILFIQQKRKPTHSTIEKLQGVQSPHMGSFKILLLSLQKKIPFIQHFYLGIFHLVFIAGS